MTNQKSIADALAQHELTELAFEVDLYRKALLSPQPDIARLHRTHVKLGLGPVHIAEDLSAADTVAAVQKELDEIVAARQAARPMSEIVAAREAVNRESAEASRPFVEKMRTLEIERKARADLDERAEVMEAALAAAKKKAPRLFSDDLTLAVQSTPRAAELRAWNRSLGGRAVATLPGE